MTKVEIFKQFLQSDMPVEVREVLERHVRMLEIKQKPKQPAKESSFMAMADAIVESRKRSYKGAQ